MQPQTQTSTPIPPPQKSSKAMPITIVIVVLLAAAGIFGAYSWQHSKLTTLTKQQPESTNSQRTVTVSKTSLVSNTGVAYPLSLPQDKQLLTTLYLPSGNNVLQTDPSYADQDELTAAYTETYNDFVANWVFTDAGTSQNPSDTLLGNNNIVITAINDWASKTDASTVRYNSDIPVSTGPMTVTDKSNFISKLKSDTAACAKDASKGFSTKDKVYNVCYNVGNPQAKDGAYVMSISGYANISGTQTYLRGFIDLANKTHQAASDQYINALKNLSTSVEAKPAS